jgi:hypothetical protein
MISYSNTVLISVKYIDLLKGNIISRKIILQEKIYCFYEKLL